MMQFIPSVSCVDGVFSVDVVVHQNTGKGVPVYESLGEFRTGLTEYPNEFECEEVILLIGKKYFKGRTFSVLRETESHPRWQRDVKGEKLICEILRDENKILRFIRD